MHSLGGLIGLGVKQSGCAWKAGALIKLKREKKQYLLNQKQSD